MNNIIGIVGGVGPYAGLDIKQKIFDNIKNVKNDQDYPEVYMLSRSSKIADRTEFILNKSKENPAKEIINTIKKLSLIGANIICIPCNTAHSPIILEPVLKIIKENNLNFVNIIEECLNEIKEIFTNKKTINLGLLATLGTYESKIYETYAKNTKINIITPSKEDKEMVHKAIYNKEYGIKAKSNPIDKRAKDILINISNKLKDIDCIVGGCTEIPLAIKEKDLNKPLIDPSLILAKTLIKKI